MPIEQARQMLRRDATARVAHGEDDRSGPGIDGDLDDHPATGVRILHGVFDQVTQRTPKKFLVGQHHSLPDAGYGHATFFGPGRQILHHRLHRGPRVDSHLLHAQGRIVRARHKQQAVDDLRHAAPLFER